MVELLPDLEWLFQLDIGDFCRASFKPSVFSQAKMCALLSSKECPSPSDVTEQQRFVLRSWLSRVKPFARGGVALFPQCTNRRSPGYIEL